MKRIIPQTTVIACDFCGVDTLNQKFRLEAQFIYRAVLYDQMLDRCGQGDQKWDACDTCAGKILALIEKLKILTADKDARTANAGPKDDPPTEAAVQR